MIVFEKHFDGYDDWYKTPLGIFVDAVETDAAFGLLKPRAGQHILDVGCGTGNFCVKLCGMGCTVTGVDIAEPMLEAARQKTVGLPLSLFNMDCGAMDFPENHFDHVLSMAAFEFIPQPDRAYREMLRVVKPGGSIVIGTIQRGGAWHGLYTSEACKDSAYAHGTFKSKEDLIALDPAAFAGAKECLYVPPGLPESQYTPASEAAYAKTQERGGFVCVRFYKSL